MKYVKSKEYRCIHGDTPEEFQDEVNKVLAKYPTAEMKIDTLVPYLCHAWIRVEKLIPETKADEYELNCDVHYCIECPFLDRPAKSNKNQKRFPCEHAEWGITATDSVCCDKFYDWYEKRKMEGGE